MTKIFFLCIALIMSNLAHSQESHAKKLDELFTFYQQQNLFNGSVLVARKGEVLLNKGFGQADVVSKKGISSKSLFQIYSVTKTFTATVILKLMEEKKLSLSDKLSKFYPDFPNAESITIEHLLTHTSGMYDFTRGNEMADQTEKSFVEFHKTKPLDFPVGTDWSYSNSGYYFLGYIIEKTTGMTYEAAVAQYIFKPLKMKQSGFAFKFLKNKEKSIGYQAFTEKSKTAAKVYDPPGPYAAGGIYSTVEDLYKYYKGLNAYKIISKTTLEKAYTPFKNNYGYGWVLLPMFDKKTVGHSGAGAGFRSQFVQVPEDDVCIVLLTNTERDLNNAVSAVLKVLYDKPYKVPTIMATKKDELKQYVGTYQANPGFTIYVNLENEKLVSQPSNQPKSFLYPEKQNLFYVEEMADYIHFSKNKKNEIDTLIFNREGRALKAARIFPAWGIIGGATANGWEGADVKMTETSKGVWTIQNIELKEGEFKFRYNDDWTKNLGYHLIEGLLLPDGNNLQTRNGVFDISLDLSDEDNPKYKIVKK
jgi:CubicO group peptidase (beta-lactamase class C family)